MPDVRIERHVGRLQEPGHLVQARRRLVEQLTHVGRRLELVRDPEQVVHPLRRLREVRLVARVVEHLAAHRGAVSVAGVARYLLLQPHDEVHCRRFEVHLLRQRVDRAVEGTDDAVLVLPRGVDHVAHERDPALVTLGDDPPQIDPATFEHDVVPVDHQFLAALGVATVIRPAATSAGVHVIE